MRIPLADSVLLFGADNVEAAVPAPVRSTLSNPSEGGDTSNVTVRATPSVKTIFTAPPAVGTPVGTQLPAKFQLPVPSIQFFAEVGVGGDNNEIAANIAAMHEEMHAWCESDMPPIQVPLAVICER